MKISVSQLRKILREQIEQYFEDVDRVRRHEDGYGDDLEEKCMDAEMEDVDRVRRHEDGYGDDLEEKENEEKKAKSHAQPSEVQDSYPLPAMASEYIQPVTSVKNSQPALTLNTETAPPGMEDVVMALKKNPKIDNPFAVAWALYNKKHNK